jgi:hypothetical protein
MPAGFSRDINEAGTIFGVAIPSIAGRQPHHGIAESLIKAFAFGASLAGHLTHGFLGAFEEGLIRAGSGKGRLSRRKHLR